MEPIEIQVLHRIKEIQNGLRRDLPISEPEKESGIIELIPANNIHQNEFNTHFFQVL